MNNLKNITLIASLVVLCSTILVPAEMATIDEALIVADNWISMIIQEKGGWGDANTAFVEDIQELQSGDRTIGYFCNVKPVGYIVISLRKELAPVKAYSARSNLDPTSEKGMADLIKGSMERILDTIEQLVEPVQIARTEDVSNILEINYRKAWDELEGDISTVEWGFGSTQGDIGTMNYQEGDILLTTDWHQGDPFNQDCPAPPGGDDCTRARCPVGCVATAGAQLMRYWYWPPYGSGSPYNDTYDWINMPDTVTAGSPAVERNAVAELSHEIGIAVDMDYCGGIGCLSNAYTYDMEDVYEDQYRYSTACSRRNRTSYSAVDWFNLLKVEFNKNRPVQYRILGHSIVGDGWQEIGGGPTRQYHMNYGWVGAWDDIWYTLDALNQAGGGTTSNEYVLINIFPVTSVGHTLAGSYPQDGFNFRYFDQDASGSSATFAAGQNLQFLPNIIVTSTGTIEFRDDNRIFSRGDISRGIRIDNGGINLYSGGQMKLY
jgi:peptidase C10-like protein